jgi:hypothetical protein
MEKRTLETVLRDMAHLVENRIPIGPEDWLISAQFLNIFKEDETNKLYNLCQQVAQLKVEMLPKAKSVAEVKLRIEASDIYTEMKKQEAKIERIKEHIMIAKAQSRLAVETIKGN